MDYSVVLVGLHVVVISGSGGSNGLLPFPAIRINFLLFVGQNFGLVRIRFPFFIGQWFPCLAQKYADCTEKQCKISFRTIDCWCLEKEPKKSFWKHCLLTISPKLVCDFLNLAKFAMVINSCAKFANDQSNFSENIFEQFLEKLIKGYMTFYKNCVKKDSLIFKCFYVKRKLMRVLA